VEGRLHGHFGRRSNSNGFLLPVETPEGVRLCSPSEDYVRSHGETSSCLDNCRFQHHVGNMLVRVRENSAGKVGELVLPRTSCNIIYLRTILVVATSVTHGLSPICSLSN
jgi:hypothetical protein